MNAQVRTLALAAIAAVLSGCYGDTLAVGIEYFGGGARILCACRTDRLLDRRNARRARR